MGCGTSIIEDKPLDTPLNHKMEILMIPNLDINFNMVSKHITILERLRQLIIDKQDENYLASGVCELKNPSILNYIKAVLTHLSISVKVRINNIKGTIETSLKILEIKPYLEIDADLKPECKALFDSMLAYIFAVFEENENVKTIFKDLTELKAKIALNAIEKAADIQRLEISRKFNDNVIRLNIAVQVSYELIKVIDDHIEGSTLSFKMAKEVENVKKLNDMGKLAIEMVV